MTSYFSCGAGTPNLKGHFAPLLQWKLGGTASLFLMTLLLHPLSPPLPPPRSSLPQCTPHTAYVPPPWGPCCMDEVSDQFSCWLQQGKWGQGEGKIPTTPPLLHSGFIAGTEFPRCLNWWCCWTYETWAYLEFFSLDVEELKTAYLSPLMTSWDSTSFSWKWGIVHLCKGWLR